jgi:hypothetical protein
MRYTASEKAEIIRPRIVAKGGHDNIDGKHHHHFNRKLSARCLRLLVQFCVPGDQSGPSDHPQRYSLSSDE